MDPRFFEDPGALRDWLRRNHESADVAWVGLHRKATGRPSITWPELVDQLLCFGWIDGLRRSLDGESYAIRVTPRKRDSHWSAVNVRRMRELLEAGLVEPAGRAAWEARDAGRTGQYSFERQNVSLGPELEAIFRANAAAWAYFQAQPPGYRRRATHWVVGAKRETTRRRRLDTLIRDSEQGQRIALLRR